MPVIVSTHDAQSATTPAPHKINALCMKNSIEKNKGTLVDAYGKISKCYSRLPNESKCQRARALNKAK